jgi:hypothetical protein
MPTASDMTLTVATNDLPTSTLAHAHTFASVRLAGDGCLHVRFSGPSATGTATVPWDAPLSTVLREVWNATGLRFAEDDVDTVAVFVPVPGSKALTPEAVHMERNYTLFIRSTTPINAETQRQLADLLRDY